MKGAYLRMKKLDEKTKGEQIFILLLILAASAAFLCAAGCGGGKSCEKPACGNEGASDGSARGCSIPGYGGCLSSGKGCNSA